jgi:hypothetical protein
MNKKLLFALAISLLGNNLVFAQDEGDKKTTSKQPWMVGAEHRPPKPAIPNPVIKMLITDENGHPVPREIVEDQPLTFTAISDIFFDTPPAISVTSDAVFENSQWLMPKPQVMWYLKDWGSSNRTSKRIKSQENLAPNVMVVIPENPCDDGSISCYAARKVSYYREDGVKVTCFANSCDMKLFKIKDITPPTCGLEIRIEDGISGSCWPVENPPNQFPLPKKADICFDGQLFGVTEEPLIINGYELGLEMIVSKEHAIKLKKTDIIHVKVTGDDNYRLNRDKLKFGVCAGGGGEPTPVSPVNAEQIDFTKFVIPQDPYLYLDASDMAGNRELLFIPINIIE